MNPGKTAFTPKRSLLILYGHSLASGSAEREAATVIGLSGAETVWISLDPLGGDSEPPQDVFWLRLGESNLMGCNWRQILSQAAKLVPTLEALGATAIHPLSKESVLPARIAAFVLGLSCLQSPAAARPKWWSRVPGLALRVFSPGRARRFRAQHADSGGQLAALMNVPYYLGHACPVAAGVGPVVHYLAAGQYAGLNPHPLFWTLWHARHMLHGASNITPWHHFSEIGRHAWSNPNPFLVIPWYDRQPNAGLHHHNPLLDLVAHARLGTPAPDPNPLFDRKWYEDRNVCSTLPPIEHFILHGARQPTCPFLVRHPELGATSDGGTNYTASFTQAFAGSPSRFPEHRSALQATTGKNFATGRSAVCCVLTGDYDTPQPVAQPDPNIDYFLITDRAPPRPASGWQLVVATAEVQGALKLSRAIKMNLQRYLPAIEQYKTVIYLDGNIELAGDLAPLIQGYLLSGADLGVVPHPYRHCVYEEAAAIMLQMRDSRERVMRTVEFLESQGHPPHAGLFEMGFFCFRPGPVVYAFFKLWWELYQRYGERDQLLAPLAARTQGLSLYPLMPSGQSVRTHPAFRYHPHRSYLNNPDHTPGSANG